MEDMSYIFTSYNSRSRRSFEIRDTSSSIYADICIAMQIINLGGEARYMAVIFEIHVSLITLESDFISCLSEVHRFKNIFILSLY